MLIPIENEHKLQRKQILFDEKKRKQANKKDIVLINKNCRNPTST